MVIRTQKLSLNVPYELYRKIKKKADICSEKEEKFIAMNTIILDLLIKEFN